MLMADSTDSFRIFSDSAEYRKWCTRCVAFAKSYTYDTAQAECMAEEAMIILWKRISEGRKIESTAGFLFAATRNIALNYLRHKQADIRTREGINSDRDREIELRICSLRECDPDRLYRDDIQKIVRDTLDQLGDKTGTVFRMSRFEGMSNREIAEELGISEKAVEYHITKALKELRTNLRDYLPLLLFLNIFNAVA